MLTIGISSFLQCQKEIRRTSSSHRRWSSRRRSSRSSLSTGCPFFGRHGWLNQIAL